MSAGPVDDIPASPHPLHAGPAASFDEPFEMLAARHQRVVRMLDLLARLAVHLPAYGTDEVCRQAARDVMPYFDPAGPAQATIGQVMARRRGAP